MNNPFDEIINQPENQPKESDGIRIIKSQKNIIREKINNIAYDYIEEYADTKYLLEEQAFYEWTGKVYREVHDIEVQKRMAERCPQILTLSISKRKEILENLAGLCYEKNASLNVKDELTFLNGVFVPAKLKLKEHNKKVFNTILIDYEYDKDATCLLWEKTIKEICENDINKIKCVQEFFGYCLTRETRYEKAMILLGEGATGKSTILNVLSAMIGLENISAVSLKNISDGKHVVRIQSKLINICSEMPKRAQDYETEFRAIVTGEKVTANQKYLRTYEFKPFCKLIFAANSLPHIDDPTNAFYRRLLIIELNNKIDEELQDKELSQRLYEERPGILNWAIEGLTRLRERGYFHIDDYMKNIISDIRGQNNPIILWSKDNIKFSKDNHLIKGDAYKHYVAWCKENGYRPTGLAKFGAEIYNLYRAHTSKQYQLPDGRRAWPNIAFREEYDKGDVKSELWEDGEE